MTDISYITQINQLQEFCRGKYRVFFLFCFSLQIKRLKSNKKKCIEKLMLIFIDTQYLYKPLTILIPNQIP